MAQQASKIMQSWEKTMLVDNYILLRLCWLCCCATIEHSHGTFTEYFDSSSRLEPVHAEEMSELSFSDESLLESS